MFMHRNEFDCLRWHIPPENQGQIVEVAYAACDGMAFRRVTDRSYTPGDERRTSYEGCMFDDLPEDFEWGPWNEEPEVPEHLWEDLSIAQ